MTEVIAQAKNIRLLLLDVDGIFTDGVLYLGEQEYNTKGFHIQDGLGIKLLIRTGLQIGIISGKKADYLPGRFQSIGIKHIYLGYEEKLPVYEQLKKKLNIADHEIAYMGDDLLDLPILTRVGLAVTVPDGNDAVKKYVHYITQRMGGRGAVREVCDLIMHAQGHYDSVLKSFLI
jgi:3-deoxy-D-manno-octulosonate 8-phosphate phosphatase (KDO 8-P phosphatase)